MVWDGMRFVSGFTVRVVRCVAWLLCHPNQPLLHRTNSVSTSQAQAHTAWLSLEPILARPPLPRSSLDRS